MSTDIKEARRRYRSLMRHHAKATGTDQSANADLAVSYMEALDEARIDIRNVSWLGQPTIVTNDGFLLQNLKTGTMWVHSRVAAHGGTDSIHHRARRAATPADAVRLLKGVVRERTATARMLMRPDTQSGVEKTGLYRAAMDQIVLGGADPDATERMEDGLLLLELLRDKGIAVHAVTVEYEAVALRLRDGSILQQKDGLYRVGYVVMNGDRRQDCRLQIDPIDAPEDAVKAYLEQAVPMTVEKDAERRRERDARRAASDAEEARQAKVIADYEALPPEVKAASRVMLDYLEIALNRTGAPLAMMILPLSESPAEMLERIERDGMPPYNGPIRRMRLRHYESDVFADVGNDTAAAASGAIAKG